MPVEVPTSIFLVFIAILFLTTIFMFLIVYSALKQSDPLKARKRMGGLLLIFLGWIGGQALLSLNGFYLQWETIPPRYGLLLIPALIAILTVLSVPRLYHPIAFLSLEKLTYLQVFRFPLELFFLSGLYASGIGPEIVTFEGRNFDIIMGLTAPLVAYLCFTKKIVPQQFALIWHLFSLALVVNVVVHAILSAPTPFQQFAFDRPLTIAAYLPYIYLPAVLVPIALFSSMFSIKKLWKSSKSEETEK